MKRGLAAALVIVIAVPVHAQEKASKEDAEKVLAAIKEIGCEADAGDVEKEKSGGFEIDDAKCKIGQYDIKITKDFKISSLIAD